MKYIIICSTFIILFHILRLKWFVKMVAKNELLKIIKYIDYLYLNNYIKNSLKYGFENNKNNEWKICIFEKSNKRGALLTLFYPGF